jgi:hypothetical protein
VIEPESDNALARAFDEWKRLQDKAALDPASVSPEELDRLWRKVLEEHEKWALSR